jgi:murein DD-endopeptidase MepM/ murein hydrolase activator NlpD
MSVTYAVGLALMIAALALTMQTGCSPSPTPQRAPDNAPAASARVGHKVIAFELNTGESFDVPTPDGPRSVKLISVEHDWQSDYWTEDNPEHRTIRQARVVVEVAGQQAELLARPYQPPVEVGDLRLYVEVTRQWANTPFAPLRGVSGDVRLSAVPKGMAWGTPDMAFPIRDYRWRSATYYNTWLALVPYNALYYHRGDDFGAIPDRLDIVAPWDGEVVTSPVPDGDQGSNALKIRCDNGLTVGFYHMNIETIDSNLTPGVHVAAGQALAKTGCTWRGRRTQHQDPHVHFGLEAGRSQVSPFPYLVEAYFRAYPDAMLPNAGGLHFSVPGQAVELDGSRSVARPGKEIASWTWKLHDGTNVEGPRAEVTFDRPGLYSEELIVRTVDGHEDRDYAHVRVYDPARGRDMAVGWVYYTPTRGIRPGTEVLFWNRIGKATRRVRIDFGDGSPVRAITESATHAYDKPGVYTVTFRTFGPAHEPVTKRLRVVVDPLESQDSQMTN